MGQQRGRAQEQLKTAVALSAENVYIITLTSGEKEHYLLVCSVSSG